jgi:hypothetical protein
MDFGQKAQFFTLDVISAVAYGFPFGFLTTDTDVYHYIEMSEKVVPAAMVVTVYPWINHILTSSFMKSLLPSAADPIGFGKILGFVHLLIHLGMVMKILNISMHSDVTMAMVDVAGGRLEHIWSIPGRFY